MSIKDLPVRHMLQDGNEEFIGVAIMSAEGFQKFLTDKNIQEVTLSIVPNNREPFIHCRAPVNPFDIPYFTMEYAKYFLVIYQ